MMIFRNKSLLFALAYSALVIAFKLLIVLGGYAITDFGFKWSQIITVFLIIPFIWLTVKSTRAQKGGYIGGKEALQKGLQMTMIAVVLISVYNYIEFGWKWKEIAQVYYNSDSYHHFLEKSQGIKPEQYPAIIDAQVKSFTMLSPFRYTTFKLIPYLFFGISTSFIFSVFMKRNPPFSLN